MQIKLSKYSNIIFDSDGVILNSNHIKLNAFCELASIILKQKSVDHIKKYIIDNKGVSRYQILDFIIDLANKTFGSCSYDCTTLQRMFSNLVYNNLLECDIDQNLSHMRKIFSNAKWYLVTLGDEVETKRLYKEREIEFLFDGGIYGAPRHKQDNIELIAKTNPTLLTSPTLFIGDSISDVIVAIENHFDFALLTHWSHCDKAETLCREKGFIIGHDLQDMLKC